MKKNKVLLIMIIILVIIIIAVLGLGVLYLKTDLLKSNKQLFFKYSEQALTSQKDNRVVQYLKKKEQGIYVNSGEISVNVSTSEQDYQEMVENANKINITFEGKTDNKNQKSEDEISLNYSKNVTFPITYRRDGDINGLQTDYLTKTFIAVENNNLKKLFKKLGLNETDLMPDKIVLNNLLSVIEFTDQEKSILKDRYGKILLEQLNNDQFSKIKNDDETLYTLETNTEQLVNIYLLILETAKSDDIILPRINEFLDTNGIKNKIDDQIIDEFINDINKEKVDNETIRITIYQKNNSFSKIEISDEKNSITLSQIEENDSIEYNIKIESQEEKTDTNDSNMSNFEVAINYSGLENLSDVKENYTISFSNISNDYEDEFNYYFVNEVEFKESVSIEDLNEDNTLVCNEKDSEYLQQLLAAIAIKLQQVNEEQIQELGLDVNPILYTNPFTISLGEKYINNVESSDGEISDKDEFNAKFEKYEGTQKGSVVKSLIQEAENSNSQEGTRLVELDIDISEVETSDNYIVKLNYDDDGYVNEIIFEKEE